MVDLDSKVPTSQALGPAQTVEQYLAEKLADNDDASWLNNLAWRYVTGPPEIRDVGKAIPLAERAVELEPDNAGWLNTLGVVYYRNGQFEECVETLNQAVEITNGGSAFDLFFLAMSHHRLARTAKAREAFDQAVKWWEANKPLSSAWEKELTAFRAEAAALLGLPLPAASQPASAPTVPAGLAEPKDRTEDPAQ